MSLLITLDFHKKKTHLHIHTHILLFFTHMVTNNYDHYLSHATLLYFVYERLDFIIYTWIHISKYSEPPNMHDMHSYAHIVLHFATFISNENPKMDLNYGNGSWLCVLSLLLFLRCDRNYVTL